jgi:hypothetical protein
MELNYKNKINMKAEKANLDGTPVIDQDSLYLVDFSKCESVNDLMTILSVVGFQFHPSHPGFPYIQKFLALDKPIPMRQQPEATSLELPKLKSLKK